MEKQFVTYNIALKLKKLGFDEECLAFFNRNVKFQHIFDFEDNTFTAKNSKLNLNKAICVVPLWQQVIDWFRENHRFHIEILPIPYFNNSKIAYFYHIDSDDLSNPIYDYQDKYSKVLEALKQALLLINTK